MIKNKRKYIYLGLITIFIGMHQTSAFTYGVSYANTGSGGQQTNKEPNRVVMHTKTEGNKTYEYYCEYDFR